MNRHWRLNHLDRPQHWLRMASLSDYNAHKLAELTGVTVRQLERYFYSDFHRSPQDWLNEQRMIAARYLLLEATSIKSVAIHLGFKTASHFSHVFKHCYDVSPSKYLEYRSVLYPEIAER